MKRNFLFLVLMLLAASSAPALTVDLLKEFPSQAKKSDGLAQLKKAESKRSTAECNKLAPSLMTKNKSLRGWIALSWLRCDPQSVVALDRIQASPELFERGPWRQSLWNLWVTENTDLIAEQLKKNPAAAVKRAETMLHFSETLSKDSRSNLIRILGDSALQKKNYKQALFYYEESVDLKDSPQAQDKIRFLKKALNLPLPEEKPVAAAPDDFFPEEKLEKQFQVLARSGDTFGALKEAVDLLNSYPGSRAARRIKDRPLEIYNSLFDRRTSQPEGTLDKALEILGEADESRLVEWASTIHRRADYAGSLFLAEKALKKDGNSLQSTSLLWIAGRSAQFLGEYERALRHFDELAMKNRGTDEAAEALFRMGLIQYRMRNDSTAVVLFEKLLSEKKERYDLNVRYWFVRSLQRMKSDRAEAQRKELLDLYPFSYYGIRLRAEMQQGKVIWPESAEKEVVGTNTSVWLEGTQVEAWKRFTELARSGWNEEAQIELADIPRPKNPVLQTKLAERLGKLGMATTALRWANDAMEQDPTLRKKSVMALGFPGNWKDLFVKEGARNRVQARLLMSLTRQESAFNPRAVSTSNAAGLMQLIPPTAREVAQKLGYKNLEIPEDLFRPETNIPMGSFYINDMLKQYSDSVPFALAAYNAGPARMNLWIKSRPEIQDLVTRASSEPADEIWFDELPWNETSFYVKAILRNTLLYRLLEEGNYDLGPVVWADLVDKKTLTQ